jgi:hypothetical protein
MANTKKGRKKQERGMDSDSRVHPKFEVYQMGNGKKDGKNQMALLAAIVQEERILVDPLAEVQSYVCIFPARRANPGILPRT